MHRATEAQKAQRLNRARELLRRFDHLPHAVAQLVKDCGVLSPPSLSLSPAGPAPEGTGARWRSQGGFHRQALSRNGSASSDVRHAHRRVLERNRKPSLARGLAAEKKAWLSDLHSAATRFTTNIVSIVSSLRNLNKFTNF